MRCCCNLLCYNKRRARRSLRINKTNRAPGTNCVGVCVCVATVDDVFANVRLEGSGAFYVFIYAPAPLPLPYNASQQCGYDPNVMFEYVNMTTTTAQARARHPTAVLSALAQSCGRQLKMLSGCYDGCDARVLVCCLCKALVRVLDPHDHTTPPNCVHQIGFKPIALSVCVSRVRKTVCQTSH